MGVGMSFTVDLTQAKSQSFNAIPAGMYDFEVKKVESKDGPKGKYLNVQLSIIGPTHVGRTIFDMLTTVAGSNWKLAAFLKAAGYSDEDLANPQFTLSPETLVGVNLSGQVLQVDDAQYGDENGKKNLVKTYTRMSA